MSPRVLILALFLMVGLLPQGWNKFDNTAHASLLYGLGILMIVLLFLSWKEILKEKMEKQHRFSAPNLVKILSIALSLTLVAAFMTSPIQNLGWSEVMVMLAGVGLFCIVQTFSEKERQDMTHLVLALALAAAALGLSQYFLRPESRIAGPFFDIAYHSSYWPNAFALMLLMCWPLALTATLPFQKVFELRLSKTRLITFELAAILKSLALIMLISALILTFSRAAFLVFLSQLVVIAWLVRATIKSAVLQIFSRTKLSVQNRKSLAFTLITTLLIGLTVAGFQSARLHLTDKDTNNFAAKISFAGTEQQTSFLERWQFMEGALKLIPEHPWLGSGPFSFRYIYAEIQPDFLAISDHPHNWYLKIALEEGIPAALLFIALIVVVFFIRRDLFTQKGITFSGVIAIALMGPLVHNLADYNMNFVTNQILFWTFLGFLLPAKTPTKSATLADLVKASHVTRSVPVWPLVLATGTMMIAIALIFEGAYSLTHRYALMNFSRDYFFGQARYAVSQAESSQAIPLMEHHLSLNPYDASAWNYLGEIQERKYPESALKSYEYAIKHDPANVFKYYLDYVKMAQRLKKTETDTYQSITKKAHHFLLTYPEKITHNIHFTAKSANVQSAIELAKTIGDLPLSLRIKRAHRLFTAKSKLNS